MWLSLSWLLILSDKNSCYFHKRILGFILPIFNGGSTNGPKRQKKQYLGHGSGTNHHHRPKILEIGRPEIGCYIVNKTDKISSHERESHITDWSVLLGNFNKGYGQNHGGNASGATNPTATHCHPYCTSREQIILQWLGTVSTDWICSGLHRSWHPKQLGGFLNVQWMCWQPPGIIGRDDVLGQNKWHQNWYSSILCQAFNWKNGKNKIQPGRPGSNVWKCREWDFTINGDPKNKKIK